MNDLPQRDDSSGTKDNQSKKSGAPINDAGNKRLLDEATEKESTRTRVDPDRANEPKSTKSQPSVAERASGTPIIADKIQRDLAPARAADEIKNLSTIAKDSERSRQGIVETAAPRAAAELRTASPNPLAAAESRIAAEPRAALDPRVTAEPRAALNPRITAEPRATAEPRTALDPRITAEPRVTAEPRAESSLTANTAIRRELRVASEETKAGVKEQQASNNSSEKPPHAAKELTKETFSTKEMDNDQTKTIRKPKESTHTTAAAGTNLGDTATRTDKTLTSSDKSNPQPQAPYPGERGVIKFLDLLPEEVRHHMRWQNGLTNKGPSFGITQQTGTSVRSPEAMSVPSTFNSVNPRPNSTENTPRTQSPPVRSHSDPETHPSKPNKDFKSSKYISEKRYITGAEIALAAIVSAAGIAKNRQSWTTEIKGEPTNNPQAKGVVRTETDRADSNRSNQNRTADVIELDRTDLNRTNPDQPKINKSNEAKTDSKRQASKAGVSASHLLPLQPASDGTPCVPTFISNIKVEKKQVEDLSLPRTLYRVRAKLTRRFSPPKMIVASSSSANIIENISIIQEEGEQTITYAKDIERSRPKMLISMRDTLVSIAETIYHDPNLGWLIADLNIPWVKETWIDGKRIIECKNRQTITLPIWEDVASFYKRRPSNSRPENLVTVVVDTAVDMELLQSELGTIIDGSRPKKLSGKRIHKDLKH